MYVSNLGLHTSQQDLRSLFEQYGKVTFTRIIKNRLTGLSRGLGYVKMDSLEEGSDAMNNLNGKELEGNFITITVARDRTKDVSSN